MSVDNIGVFSMLLFLFIFIFALLGLQFFAKKSLIDKNGNLVPVGEILERYSTENLESTRACYDNIIYALHTVFIVFMSDGWNIVMYNNTSPFGENWGYYAMYFVILFMLGTKIMTGLFTAILLSHFDEDSGAEESLE